jgi:hypothetical protein
MEEAKNYAGLENAQRALEGKRNWDKKPLFFGTKEKVATVVVEKFAANKVIPAGFKGPINELVFDLSGGKVQYKEKRTTYSVEKGEGRSHFGGFKIAKTQIALLHNNDSALFAELKTKKQKPKSLKAEIPAELQGGELLQGVWDGTGPVQLWFKKDEHVYATLVLDERHRGIVESAVPPKPASRKFSGGYVLLALALVAALGTGYAWRKGHLASAQIWLQQRIGR